MSSHIKTELSSPPPLLTSFESAAPRRCFVLMLCVGFVWLALGAVDWAKRFQHFGWHRGFVIRSVAAQMERAEVVVLTNGVSRGGDLSKLLGIPAVASRYEEDRPAATNHFDAAGFRNPPKGADSYSVVVVGDSYAATGPRFEDSLSAQLAARLGLPVYNHAAEGRGTFWAAARFFASEKFRGHEPRVLVWPLIEREIAGAYFAGGYFQILSAGKVAPNVAAQSARVDWNQIAPASLRKSLPNSSAYSLKAGQYWNWIRFAVFGQVNPYVIPSAGEVAGGPMLFYSEGIRAHRWSDEQRKPEATAKALRDISTLAAERGITVLFVLVPDKERVYSAALPAHIRASVRPSFLPVVEDAMRRDGVGCINLDENFRRHAEAGGEALFWRDDTHWNPAGVALASEVVAPRVRELLAAPRENPLSR